MSTERFRVTVRGMVELRGYIDVPDMETLIEFSNAMKPYGIVLASMSEEDHQLTEGWNWSKR